MKKPESTVMCLSLALLLAPVAAGCAPADESQDPIIASSNNAALLVYPNPYNNDTPNPIPTTGVVASATGYDVGGRVRIRLTVTGLPKNRVFGSHLHKLACDDPMKAGGHYQHQPYPSTSTPTDPMYAYQGNEAWLDFTTDNNGRGSTDMIWNWLPRQGEAKGIIIHDMASGTGGVSGPKLACLPITF